MFLPLQNAFLRSVVTGLLIMLTSPLTAQNNTKDPSKDTLTIGYAGSEPFVIKNEATGKPEGIAPEIWETLADNAEWHYSYKPYKNVSRALDAVQRGKIDMLAGPVSITSDRLQKMTFSQPYYQSSLSIVSRDEEPGVWERIKPLFSLKLLGAVAGFLFILALVGSLFWLAEHKTNEEFDPSPGKGIGNGMWLAIVTMSTVGYGDMAPRTSFGRIIAGAWIVIAIIFATSMVAGIASVLSLSANASSIVTNIEQLSGKKTATIAGSPSTKIIKENKSKVVSVNSLEEAMDLLNNNKVDAVVYDRPELEYYINNHKDQDLYLANAEYYKQGYGFAFPSGSPLVYKVNLKLLNLAEEQTVKKIVDSYLGEKD